MEVARGLRESWVLHSFWLLQMLVGILAIVPAANDACE
jgi:hypothetical protein